MLAPGAAIPMRAILVLAKCCMSLMEVGQKNINFGVVSKQEQGNKSKSLIIINDSEVPLLYKIVKSGYDSAKQKLRPRHHVLAALCASLVRLLTRGFFSLSLSLSSAGRSRPAMCRSATAAWASSVPTVCVRTRTALDKEKGL